MAVDKGGLRYPIIVEYDPANASRFREDIDAARESWALFKDQLAGTPGGLSAIRSAQRATAAASKEAAAEIKKEKDALLDLVARQKEERKLALDLVKAHTAEAQGRGRITAGIAEQQAALRAMLERKAEELRMVRQLKAAHAEEDRARAAAAREAQRIADVTAKQQAREAKEAARQAKEAERAKKQAEALAAVGKEADGANNAVTRLLFTFRRLVGVFAIFQAARVAFREFVEFLKSGVQVNAQIETAALSVTGLITSLARVRNAQGEVVEGAQAIALAQEAAREQTELLRADTLKTAASYEDLLNAFQTAIGPGLRAGLQLDEIRKLAVRIAQVAPLASVQGNQLAEEIRSLTIGPIRPNTSRIATIFGINNEDVTRAREAGKLFEFLEERFSGMEVISGRLQFTFDGLVSRVKSLVQLVAGNASTGLFGELKNALGDIQRLLLDPTSLQPRPEVVATFRVLFDALSNVVRAARQAAGFLGFENTSKAIAGFAAVLETLGRTLVGIIEGGIAGFSFLFTIVSDVLGLFGVTGQSLTAIASTITEVLVISFAIRAAWQVTDKLFLSVLLNVTKIDGVVKSIKITSLGWLAIIAGLVVLAAEIGNQLTGSQFKLTTIIKSFAITVKDMGKLLVLGFGTATAAIGEAFVFAFRKAEKVILDIISNIALKTAQLLTSVGVSEGVTTALENFAGSAARASAAVGDNLRRSFTITDAAAKEFANTLNALSFGGEDIANLIAAEDSGAVQSLGETVANAVRDGLNKVLSLIPNDVKSALDAAKDAVKKEGAGIALSPRGSGAADDKVLDDIRGNEQRARAAALEAEQIRRIADLRQNGATAARLELETREQALAKLLVEQEALRENNRVEAQRLERRLQEGAAPEEEQAVVAGQLVALRRQQAAEEDLIGAKIDEATAKLREQQEVTEGSFFGGALRGLQQIKEELPTSFEQGIAAVKEITDSFISGLSDAVVDAFDPSNDETLSQRIAGFLQGIARLLLQQAITNIIAAMIPQQAAATTIAATQVAAASTAAGIITAAYATAAATEIAAAQTAATIRAGASVLGANSGGLVGSVLGLNSGGPVGYNARMASYAHSMARGFASGGGYFGRPAGLHPKDTVPAWLTPNEFVQPVKSVRRYGLDLMRALQNGAADPVSVRAAAGLGPRAVAARASSAAASIRGYASGGSVASAGPVADAQPVPAVVVFNEKAVHDMLTTNRTAFLRFMRENASEIDAAQRRRGR